MPFPHGRYGLALLALTAACAIGLTPFGGSSASFDCAKAGTPSERAICADPVTSKLDEDLAKRWRQAEADSRYPAELKRDQFAWLKRRNGCKDDNGCLRGAYTRRLAELAPDVVAGPFDWRGTWTRINGNAASGELVIAASGKDTYTIGLEATAGANMGSSGGLARGDGNSLDLVEENDPECRIVLKRVHRQIQLDQHDGNCGAGSGVYYDGRYVPDRSGQGKAAPAWDLLSLNVIRQPRNDAELRRLLGAADYAAVVRRINRSGEAEDEDEDGFGAQVGDYALRGVAVNTRVLLMQTEDGRFWVALLDFDKDINSEVRYYSNAPGWTDKLPKTVTAWLRTVRDSIPMRMMSAPGKPTLE